jgi:hypothetical protein
MREVAGMPESLQPSLISARRPVKRKASGARCRLLLLGLFLGSAIQRPVGGARCILPIAATIMFLNDSITSALLFAHFAVLRSRPLLVLANGGAFAPAGLLRAGLQTSPWLFTVWHMTLPATIIAYALLGRASAEMQLVRSPVGLYSYEASLASSLSSSP